MEGLICSVSTVKDEEEMQALIDKLNALGDLYVDLEN